MGNPRQGNRIKQHLPKGKLRRLPRDSLGQVQGPLGRSRTGAGIGYRGKVHPWVWLAVERVYTAPLAIESNYAREKRWAIAFAASVGWITVIDPGGHSYGREWRVTAEGLVALEHQLKE